MMFLGTYLDSAALTGITGLLTLPFVYRMYRQDRKEQWKEKKPLSWRIYVLAAILGIISNQAVSILMNLLSASDYFSNQVQNSLFESSYWIQFISLGIIAPVTEEVIFRGLVYQRLKRHLNTSVAVVLAAGIFAVYHGNMMQIVFAFPMALAIIWCYERWKSLAVPIIFHAAGNLFAVVLHHLVKI